ncbi:MAG: serine/threonine-protein phosphatase [bacterium]|nr:serine/threonine-protein phosphatase [bacterium]
METSDHDSYRGRARGMAAAARSHPGKVRTINEDTFVCAPKQGLFAVIDGMGGVRAGEVAARLTREILLGNLAKDADLRVALNRANEAIYHRAARNPDEQGMGCVATAGRVVGPDLVIAHVGDTRALLASRTGCEQLTRDHTVAADLQEQQASTQAEAGELPGRHQVTRDVGGRLHGDFSWIDSATTPFEVGDLLLLCSDGLADLVSDGELFRILDRARKEDRDVVDLVNHLIEMALERGAPDNVTVLAVRREQPPKARGKAGAKGKVTTDKVPAELIAGQRRFSGRTLTAGCAIAAVAFLAGWLAGSEIAGPRPADPTRSVTAEVGVVGAANNRYRAVNGGAAGLDGVIEQSATLTALGPLRVAADQTRTEIASGVAVAIRGAQVLFAAENATWEIHVGAGSRLELRQAAIRAPQLLIRVVFEGDDGLLLFENSHLDVGELTAEGPRSTRVEVHGGALHLRRGRDGPQLQGPAFAGVVNPASPFYGPAEVVDGEEAP